MGTAVEEVTRRIAEKVTGMLFENSGHYPAEEEPEKFNREAIAFLKS